jgi:hypothetical protein
MEIGKSFNLENIKGILLSSPEASNERYKIK